jgi:hypothetical protein
MEKNKLVNVMDYNEFDNLVNKNLPQAKGKYEFIEEHEANNYSCYMFDANKEKCEEDFFKEYNLPEILKGQLNNTHALFNYLCSLGILEPGSYLIKVYW